MLLLMLKKTFVGREKGKETATTSFVQQIKRRTPTNRRFANEREKKSMFVYIVKKTDIWLTFASIGLILSLDLMLSIGFVINFSIFKKCVR